MKKILYEQEMGIKEEIIDFVEKIEAGLKDIFVNVDNIAEYNQLKVLGAMQKNRLSDTSFQHSSGYGYNDIGRDTLEDIYAHVFRAELAIVRPQIISGTHALTIALSGNLKHGDELVSVTGQPYDTLLGVIGIRKTKNSLMDNGIIYKQVDLINNQKVDFDGIKNTVTSKTKMVMIQRSKGYSFRHSLTVDEIGEIISFVKGIDENIICMVDNCYGEFVEEIEPTQVGADLCVGSLIKNIGGGLSPVGGYIVGKEVYVENCADRLSAPGLGREVGPSLGFTGAFAQGLFLAPNVVSSSLKTAILAAAIFEKLGFQVMPTSKEKRSDIVQAINMKSENYVVKFCQGIQKGSPVDSFVVPEPWDMPGYDCKVIMAAGAFVQGSSIELSADAPIKEPYTVFLQGGLTYFHGKIGVISALNNLCNSGLVLDEIS